MKPVNCFVWVMGFYYLLLFSNPLPGQYQIQQSVLGNGGLVVRDSVHQLSGTLGQTMIGASGDTVSIGWIGFWYASSNMITGTSEPGAVLPVRFQLKQNFPNPFNPLTTIAYSVARKTRVYIAVYNLLGERVAVLVNRIHSPGHYRVQLNGTRLASGVYFYKMVTREYVKTRKMILLR